MNIFSKLQRALMLLGLTVVVTACAAQHRYHGYVPTDAELEAVSVGDSKADVSGVIGKPSTAGLLADSGWYYVRSEFRHLGGLAPRELDRQVVAISFGKNERVSNIERFGLEQGQVVALSRRVTEENVQGITLIGQIFRNFGRLSPDEIFQ